MSKKASITLSVIITLVLGLWLWTLFIPKNNLDIGGSTSVDPVMQRLTNKYHEADKKAPNFIYSSSGSRGGLSNTESNIYQMGFISREIDAEFQTQTINNGDGSNAKKYEDNQEVSVTGLTTYLESLKDQPGKYNYFKMGTDAIVLTYHASPNFQKHYAKNFEISMASQADRQLIYDIYQKKFDWKSLAQQLRVLGKITDDETTIDQKLNAREDKALIQPYARETGSGTRSAFENLIKFREFASGTKPSQALETNSNGIMFTGIQASKSSFGYLSLNYLPAINQDKNLNAVIVDGFDPLKTDNFRRDGRIVLTEFENYALTRPFIGVFKTTLSNQRIGQIAAFLAWMGQALPNKNKNEENNSEAYKIYEHEGLIPQLSFNYPIVQTQR